MKAIGFPLYVNGKLIPEPVTISHVPGNRELQGVFGGFGVDPSMGHLGEYAAYRATPGLGAEDTPVPPPPGPAQPIEFAPSPGLVLAYKAAATLSAMAFAYHGYKRNQSVGWAIGWMILGGFAPIIAWPVALAQGFGERKSLTPNRGKKHGCGCGTKRRRLRRNGRKRRR